MNNVLSEILSTGVTKTANEESTVVVHSSISPAEGEFLQHIVRLLDPKISLEIGLAYGISALFICDALIVRKGTRHIVIDPNQHEGKWGDAWNGIGIANLNRAGFGRLIRFIEAPSYRALPELERKGQRIDFAFIDGWHTFDFALVDLFFIDRMLNVGGVIVFDDANWPAVRKVCRFIATNLAYSALGASFLHKEFKFEIPVHGPIHQESLDGISSTETECSEGTVNALSTCVAFQKTSDDTRRWDHYVEF